MSQEKQVFGKPNKTPPLEISGQMKVKTLRDQFKTIFGLTLRVYNLDGKEADDNATIASIRAGAKATEATVNLRETTKASDPAIFFRRQLGIMVDVFSADNTELPTKNVSLKNAAEGKFDEKAKSDNVSGNDSGDNQKKLNDFQGDNGKWGFKDETGKVVIEAKYDAVKSFWEGLAEAQIDDKWGFIDNTGKIVIDFQYFRTYPFQNGFAPVKIRNSWGLIDKTGKVVIDAKYDNCTSFYEYEDGYLMAEVELDDEEFFIDIEGNKTYHKCTHCEERAEGEYCDECGEYFCYMCMDNLPSGIYCHNCSEGREENDD